MPGNVATRWQSRQSGIRLEIRLTLGRRPRRGSPPQDHPQPGVARKRAPPLAGGGASPTFLLLAT
jgi:hypothetical protein